MMVGLPDLWTLLLALMVVVLPLLLAWWLVGNGSRFARTRRREPDDNAQDHRTPH